MHVKYSIDWFGENESGFHWDEILIRQHAPLRATDKGEFKMLKEEMDVVHLSLLDVTRIRRNVKDHVSLLNARSM